MDPVTLALGLGSAGVAAGLGTVGLSRWRLLGNGRAAALGVALGSVVGHAAINGALAPWPVEVTHFLPHVALLGALGASVAAGKGLAVRGAIHLAVGSAVAFVLLWPRAGQLDGTELAIWIGLGAVGTGIGAALWEGALRDTPMGTSATALTLATAVVAVSCALAGTVLVGQLAGALCAAIVGVTVAARVFRTRLPFEAAGSVVGTLAVAFALVAAAYAELPPVAVALVALLGLPALLLRRARPDLRIVAHAAAVILVGGAIITLAVLRPGVTPAGASEDADYGYGY